MKLINSKVELIPQEKGLLGVYKQIEIGGRTAYKSEDKITEDSAKKFVDMLINRGHLSPMEHGTIYLTVPASDPNAEELFNGYFEDPYSRICYIDDNYYVTTNARVITENHWQDDLKFLTEPTIHHALRMTVRITCSRSIGNEVVRHRTFKYN